MSLTSRVSARLLRTVCVAALAAFSLLAAQPSQGADSLQIADTLSAARPDSAAALPSDSAAMATLEALSAVPDSLADSAKVAEESASEQSASAPREVKSVLYLGGGKNALWYHLGVLYAIEAYSVPVDSVVGTSWGALVGYLWAKGVSLDDIQRILLDPDFTGLSSPDNGNVQGSRYVIPVSESGLPALRERFSFYVDSSGDIHRRQKMLVPDSAFVRASLSHLRLQESILRHGGKFKVPFSVLGCDGVVGNSFANILASLPVKGSEMPGEYCPYLALPAEDSPDEMAMISVVDPLRGELRASGRQKAIAAEVLKNLGSQPGIIVRPHSVSDTSRNGWIQAGFSALESKLSQMTPIGMRRGDYGKEHAASIPWFQFKPSFDSLSAETHSPVKSYWNSSDTGIVAPRNFAYSLLQFPAVDSVSFDMLPDGDVLVDAEIKPTFDVAVGGFGSNAIGPNAYAEIDFYHVEQMEIQLALSGFWGGTSYGFSPKARVARLWSMDWGLEVGYVWQKLQPLESYDDNIRGYYKVHSEKKSDILASLFYRIDLRQKVSAEFLFASRVYELERRYYPGGEFEMYPASQKLHYEYVVGDGRPWFSENGFAFHGDLGLTSVGYDFGFDEIIPTFITSYFDAQYAISPKPFVTLNALAAFAMNKYHKHGYGYVYPESFEIDALDNCIRPRIAATPWSTEWINPDLASHHYGLLRFQGGLHYRGSGLWLNFAYIHDFEENPTSSLEKHRFVFEPALRLSYKSINIYAGMSRIVDSESFGDLGDFDDYRYFIRIGEYDLF